MDFSELLNMYLNDEITGEQVEFLFGREILDKLILYVTDPFDEVFGG